VWHTFAAISTGLKIKYETSDSASFAKPFLYVQLVSPGLVWYSVVFVRSVAPQAPPKE
jgi:hypothetical protein